MSNTGSIYRLPGHATSAPQVSIKESNVLSDGVSTHVGSIVEPSASVPDSEMRELVLKKIQNLPPLPKTLMDIYALRNSDYPDFDALLKIIQTDPMIVANLLKISNSVMYGFSRQIKAVPDVLKILGYRMVINVAVCTGISGHLKPDMHPYGIEAESFTETSALRSAIIEKWPDRKLAPLQSDLQFAAFLQEVWAIVISKVAIEKGLVEQFKASLEKYRKETESDGADEFSENPQTLAEEEVFGLSSEAVSALVFRQWNFNQSIIDLIEGSVRPEENEDTMVGAAALKIAKTIAPIGGPALSETSIETAREYVLNYGLDETAFDRMTERMEDPAG